MWFAFDSGELYTQHITTISRGIGDRALDLVLTGLERELEEEEAVAERMRKKEDPQSVSQRSVLHRPVLTHVQILNEDLISRMSNLSNRLEQSSRGPLIANVQPQFVKSDLPIVLRKLGPERTKTSYIWRTLSSRELGRERIRIGPVSDRCQTGVRLLSDKFPTVSSVHVLTVCIKS